MAIVIYTREAVRDLIRRAKAIGLDVKTPGVFDSLTVKEFAALVRKAESRAESRSRLVSGCMIDRKI